MNKILSSHSVRSLFSYGCLLLATALVLHACTKDSGSSFTADCSAASSFATDVQPIIQTSCATTGCHAAGSKEGPSALTTYQQVYNIRNAIRTSVTNGSMRRATASQLRKRTPSSAGSTTAQRTTRQPLRIGILPV